MPQTTYDINHDAAFAGQQASSVGWDVISRVNSSGASIPVGRALVRDGVGAKLADAGAELLGIAMYTLEDTIEDGGLLGYKDETEVAIMEAGMIWAIAGETVAVGDPVSFRHAAGTLGELGTTADANREAIPGATWESAATVGVLAKVKIPLANAV